MAVQCDVASPPDQSIVPRAAPKGIVPGGEITLCVIPIHIVVAGVAIQVVVSRTTVHFIVPAGFDGLETALALADSPALQGPGRVRFSVVVDGEEVFARELTTDDGVERVFVDVGDAEVVTLTSRHVEGEPGDAVWPVWVDPVLVR